MIKPNTICNGIAIMGVVIQTDYLFNVISLILTCISITISILYTCWKWYKTIKEQKDITKEQADEIKNDIDKNLNEMKNIKGDGNNG